jgi:hypothetical protein
MESIWYKLSYAIIHKFLDFFVELVSTITWNFWTFSIHLIFALKYIHTILDFSSIEVMQ